MTTLEKMADAILNDLLGRKGVGDELIAIEDDDPEIWKEIKQAVARAALKELRVPSEGMWEAMARAICVDQCVDPDVKWWAQPIPNDDGTETNAVTVHRQWQMFRPAALSAHQAAIDHILEEKD